MLYYPPLLTNASLRCLFVAHVEFLENVEVEKVYAGKLLLVLMDLINGIIQILCVLKMLNNKLYPLADKQGFHCGNG